MRTHAPEHDLVSRKIHDTRVWEPFETQLWLRAHSEGSVVVDVGANLGYYSLLSALCASRAHAIFAFEPARSNYDLLCANLRVNGCEAQVKPYRAALSTDDSCGTLHLSEDNYGDHQIYVGDDGRSEEAIELRNGAELLGRQIDAIDVLKVDTQGSEFAVISGLSPLLRKSGQSLKMIVELTPFSLCQAGSSGRELITLIASLDLPLHIVDHIEHRLVRSDAEALCEWSDNVAATSGDRGFMNIFAGTPPPGL